MKNNYISAIKIDPASNNPIHYIQLDVKDGCVDLEQLRMHLNCRFFTAVHIPNGDSIFVDDEGLFRNGIQPFFRQEKWYPDMLVGCGIIMGSDHEGNSVDANVHIEEVANGMELGIAMFGVDSSINN